MLRPIKDRTAIAFLLGFALCYAGGAYLCFNLLTTLRYPVDDALPRAALWWWTARVGNDMLADRLQKYPFRVTLP
jgi:hypothetical protein